MKDLENSSRREFVKKVAYVAPVVLTLPAIPAFASSGSSPTDAPPTDTPTSGPRRRSGQMDFEPL